MKIGVFFSCHSLHTHVFTRTHFQALTAFSMVLRWHRRRMLRIFAPLIASGLLVLASPNASPPPPDALPVHVFPSHTGAHTHTAGLARVVQQNVGHMTTFTQAQWVILLQLLGATASSHPHARAAATVALATLTQVTGTVRCGLAGEL